MARRAFHCRHQCGHAWRAADSADGIRLVTRGQQTYRRLRRPILQEQRRAELDALPLQLSMPRSDAQMSASTPPLSTRGALADTPARNLVDSIAAALACGSEPPS